MGRRGRRPLPGMAKTDCYSKPFETAGASYRPTKCTVLHILTIRTMRCHNACGGFPAKRHRCEAQRPRGFPIGGRCRYAFGSICADALDIHLTVIDMCLRHDGSPLRGFPPKEACNTKPPFRHEAVVCIFISRLSNRRCPQVCRTEYP